MILQNITLTNVTLEGSKLTANVSDPESLKRALVQWPPVEGDTYWYATERGLVLSDSWSDHEYDRARLAIGNCYPTKKLCEISVKSEKISREFSRVRAAGRREEQVKLQDEWLKLRYKMDDEWRPFVSP